MANGCWGKLVLKKAYKVTEDSILSIIYLLANLLSWGYEPPFIPKGKEILSTKWEPQLTNSSHAPFGKPETTSEDDRIKV